MTSEASAPIRTVRDRFSGRQFVSLEAGRFLAAFFVTCFHVEGAVRKLLGRYDFDDIFRAGHSGVEYFFVLSGFIMFWIHGRDYGKPHAVPYFLARRAIRILPMYWIAFAAMGAGLLIFPALLQGRIFTFWDVVCDALLAPRSGEMVLNVAWTLRQEFVFYVFFALSITSRRLGLWPVWLWQGAIMLHAITGPAQAGPFVDEVFSIYNLGFGAGIIAARAVAGGVIIRPLVLALVGAAGFIAVASAETVLGWGRPHLTNAIGEGLSPLLYSPCAALMVAGFATLETRAGRAKPSPLVQLALLGGGASYVLYLFHGMVTSVLLRIIKALPVTSSCVLLMVMCAIAVLVAVCIHSVLEKPLLSMLNRGVLATRTR